MDKLNKLLDLVLGNKETALAVGVLVGMLILYVLSEHLGIELATVLEMLQSPVAKN